MAFTPKSWQDLPSTSTPINAAALVDLETRLSNYTNSAGGVSNPLTTAQDIFIATTGGTPARLPVGTTGQRMVVRSDGTLGYVDHRISVQAWGCVGDGTTDDTTAFQNAINAAAALTSGGAVEMAHNKTYKVTTGLQPASNVCVYGQGPSSVIAPSGAVSAFLWPGTTSNYLTDATFRDFKVDGTNQTGSYNVATKGIQCPYARRVICDGVQVVNCIATGIAFDYPDEVAIVNCVSNGNGRLWTTGNGGGAGIGIGTGNVTTPDQTMTVANCHCFNNGSYGIFFEAQVALSTQLLPGIRIIGNYCSSNSKSGIGISGGMGAIVQGNTCVKNGTAGSGTGTSNIGIDTGTLARYSGELVHITGNFVANGLAHGIYVTGVAATNISRWCKISNNVVYNNGGTTAQDGHGIFLDGAVQALKGFSIDGNYVTQNKQCGIVVSGGTGHLNIAIRNNDVFSNGQTSGATTDGIRINAPITGLQLSGNQCYAQSGVGNQVTGINLTATATLANAKITGNDVRGNVTNSMLVNATVDGTVLIKDNPGYNPVGTLSVSVPSTTVAVAAAQTDRTFYITTSTGSTTVAISGGPTITLTASALNTVRVPAGQTLTPTYTNAPTWVVEGE